MKTFLIGITTLLMICNGFAQNLPQSMAMEKIKQSMKKDDLFCSGEIGRDTLVSLYIVHLPYQRNLFTASYAFSYGNYGQSMGQCFVSYTYASASNKVAKMESNDGKCSLIMNLESFTRTGSSNYNSTLALKEGRDIRSLSLTCKRL